MLLDQIELKLRNEAQFGRSQADRRKPVSCKAYTSSSERLIEIRKIESVRDPSPIRCVQIPSVGKEIKRGGFLSKIPPLKK
jgi:hypothetical protein